MIRVLDSAGAAILEGPRGCGKTMTGLAHASSYTLLDTPEAQTAAEIDPRLLLAGASPRLLDEWQLIPQIWNLARREVDFSSEPGRFILTGSAVPAADPIRHTGAARFIRVRQRTMTWKRSVSPLNPQLSTTCSSTRRPWADTYITIATPTGVSSMRF